VTRQGGDVKDNDSFTVEQAAAANKALRAALGLPAQRFSAQEFVGMISEEIEQLRSAGQSDDDIARLLAKEVDVTLDADLIGRYYAADSSRKANRPNESA